MEMIAGPIPGENYTSDTRNYPWHRAPEFDDLDEAIEYASKKILSRDASLSMMTLAKNGVPLSSVAQMFLMSGVMRGKWTVDYALLMAGPVVHILSLVAKASDITFSLGIEETPIMYSDGFFKAMAELDTEEEAAVSTMGGMLGSSIDTPDSPETPLEGSPAPVGQPPVGMGGFAGAAAGGAPMAPSDGMQTGDVEQEVDVF